MVFLHVRAARYIGFDPTDNLRFPLMLAITMVIASVIHALNFFIDSKTVSLLVIPLTGFSLYLLLSIRYDLVEETEIEALRGMVS
jgi:hypothetical protein